ncbi:MAG: diacylglycerol kinase family protein [Clostridiales bacterium]|jgi:diacylglycerol kinase|nr:diacylglycerol kinase family protein [Clostridiales bacterium]
MISILRKFLKSFKYAIGGIITCAKHERNFRIHIFAALLIIYIIPYYNFSNAEAVILISVTFLVLILEMINTALEHLVDLVSPDHHPIAGVVKDLAAGSVGMSAICALIVGWRMLIMNKNLTQIWAPLFTTWHLFALIAFIVLGCVFVFLPVIPRKTADSASLKPTKGD